jgi:uncharacterized protein YndB with AHSA1/START domain
MELRPGGTGADDVAQFRAGGADEVMPEKYAGERGPFDEGASSRGRPAQRLVYTWPETSGSESEVSFELAERGDKVLLTLTHRKLGRRGLMVGVGGGWHSHSPFSRPASKAATRRPSGRWSSVFAREYEARVPTE